MSVYVQIDTTKDFYYELLEVEPPLRTTRGKISIFEKNVSGTLNNFRKKGQVIYIDHGEEYESRIAPQEGDIILRTLPRQKETIDTIVETMQQFDTDLATLGGIYEDACVLGIVGDILKLNKKVHVIEGCTDGILRDDRDKMLALLIFSTNENLTVTPSSEDRLEIIKEAVELRNKLRDWKNLTKSEKRGLFNSVSNLTTKTTYVFRPFSKTYQSDSSEPICIGDVKTVLCAAGETGLSLVEARDLIWRKYKEHNSI